LSGDGIGKWQTIKLEECFMNKKIYKGVTILDITNNAAGPACCAEFADHGATVIKVERPAKGDDTRSFNPILENGESLLYHWFNRGKKSVVIAMDDPEGQEMIMKLAAKADVLVESYRPGIMKKFGLDYEEVVKVNPSIIYCSISAFGQYGPYAHKPGYDLIAQALSGIMDMTGEPDGPPIKSGFILGDFTGALNAFGSISAALFHRKNTGEGQYIDVSLLEGLVNQNGFFEMASVVGKNPTRIGQHHVTLCPYGVYSGKNGQSAVICAPNNKLWQKLCGIMGREDILKNPDFSSGSARTKNQKLVIQIIEEWLSVYDNISDAVKLMDEAGIPCCLVKSTKDLLDDEHLAARGMFVEIDTPPSYKKVKKLKIRGPWVKFSKTPMEPSRSSDLGEYNYEVLGALGYSREDIDQFQQTWKEKVLTKLT